MNPLGMAVRLIALALIVGPAIGLALIVAT